MDCTKYCHPTDKLTDDLLIEILCRLPVKSLLLCRCVSKAWHALISNAQYRDKLPRTMSGHFYHACGTASDWGYHVEYVGMQSYNESSSVDANLSFLPCGKYTSIVDCCNGLLLCHSSKGRTAKYYVCNPVTKRWATLPNTDYRVHPLALVFDPNLSRHYSVLGFNADRNSGDKLETLVSFSSETGKWVEKLVLWGSEMDTYFRRHVFFNGTIHLLAYRNPIVVVVDFEREIYRRIDLPATKVDGRSCLGQSQGYLHYSEISGNQMIVWVLKNYDRNEWVVKHSTSLEVLFEKHQVQPVPSPSHQSSSDVFDILPFHPDLDVVFLKIHGKIFSYHLISAKLAEIMNSCRRTGSFYVYTPCLLLEDLGL